MEVIGGQGHYLGDHGIQINLFSGGRPSGPVVAGNVPQAPPAFQPREDLMTQLRAAGPGVSVVRAVTGMRGVGKTQLAAAYARECIDAGWRLVAWVNAEDTTAIFAGLVVVADRLGISHSGVRQELVAGEVRNRLEADGDRCLLVFDNVTDPDSVRAYTPSAGRSQVIVTSTQSNTVTLGRQTQIDVFTEDQSLAFLVERTGIDDREGAKALADEVGHLPLALAQAAAVIQAQQVPYQVYIGRLRSYPTPKYLPAADGDQYPHGVAKAIALSVESVSAADPTGICATLLAVVSLLSPEGVSRQLLYSGGSEFAGPLGVGPEEIDAALARLMNSSLLFFSRGDGTVGVVSAHRLVMRVVRERLIGDGMFGTVLDVIFNIFAAADEPLTELAWDRPTFRELARHATSVAQHAVDNKGERGPSKPQMRLVADWLGWLALHSHEELNYKIERVYNLSIELHNLEVKNLSLGLISEDGVQIDPEQALHEYRDGKRDWKDKLQRTIGLLEQMHALHADTTERIPDRMLAQTNLAYGRRLSGRTDEAVSLYRQSLADLAKHLGEEHPLTLTARNNVAYVLQAAGQPNAAIPLYEESLAGLERALGAGHPHAMIVRDNLASALRAGDGPAEEPAD